MEKLKVHIRLVLLWDFRNNKNAIETVKNYRSVYRQGIITKHLMWKWFSKFRSGDQDIHQTMIKMFI